MTYNPAVHHRRSIRLKGYDYSQCGAYFITIVTQGRECLFGHVVDGEMQLNDAGRMIEWWWDELANKFPHSIPDVAVVMPNHFHGIVVITDGAVDVGADLCVRPSSDLRVRPSSDLRVRPSSDAHPGMGAHTGAPLRVRPSSDAHPEMGAHTGAPLHVHPSSDAHPEMGAHTGAPLRVRPAPDGDMDPRVRPEAGLPQIVQWFKTMTANAYIRGVKTLEWAPFPGKLWQRNYYEHIVRDEKAHDAIWQYIMNNPSQWDADSENPEKVA